MGKGGIKINHKELLDKIVDSLISNVQSGRKTLKIGNIQKLLNGYDHIRFKELNNIK